MLIPSGQLEKLKIIAFSDPMMLPSSIVGTLETLINPQGYRQEFGIEYGKDQAIGESIDKKTYKYTSPESMDFRFLFDRTGAIPSSPSIPGGIVADIELFKELTYKFHGKIHRPLFLLLTWGSLLFPCVLKTMNIEYKLFNAQGIPLRAEIQATFNKFLDSKLQKKIDNLLSPDLTHIHEVKAGDTLPLLTHKMYGDAKYYLEVARVNQLVDFKSLTPGQKLVFPPLEK